MKKNNKFYLSKLIFNFNFLIILLLIFSNCSTKSATTDIKNFNASSSAAIDIIKNQNAIATNSQSKTTEQINSEIFKIENCWKDDFGYIEITGALPQGYKIICNDLEPIFPTKKNKFKIRFREFIQKPIKLTVFDATGKQIYNTEIFDNEAPSAPENFEVMSVDNSRVELRWVDNRETDLLGYKLYINPNNKGWKLALKNNEIIKSNEYTITGLNSGVKYNFKLTAIDKFRNESPFSNELSITTLGVNSGCCD